MIQREEFQGEGYFRFKKDVERIIANLEAGEYSIELSDSADPLEIINEVSKNNPEEYLNQCRFFHFFSEIYKLPYVGKLLQYAEEHGYVLIGPDEFKDEYSMEHFVKDVLARKQEGVFNIDRCFELVFIKKNAMGQHSLSDVRIIHLLDYEDSHYRPRRLSDLQKEIQGIEK